MGAHVSMRVVLRREESLHQILDIHSFVAKVACCECSIHDQVPVIAIFCGWLLTVLTCEHKSHVWTTYQMPPPSNPAYFYDYKPSSHWG